MRPHRPKVLRLLPRQIHHRVRSNQKPDDGRVRPRRAVSRIIVRPSRFASREELSLSVVVVCKNHVFSDSFRAILKMIARHPSTRRRRHHRPRSRRRKHSILAERSRRRPRLRDVYTQRRRRRRRRSGLETVSKMRFSIDVCERRRRRRRRSPRRGTRRQAQRSSHLSLFLRSLSTCAYGFACVIRHK